jgi:phage terminase large subunit GpA-like protein
MMPGMDQQAQLVYRKAFNRGLKPESLLTVSEWADQWRVLSQRGSAEPGPWRTDRTPYLREIMDCLSPSSLIENVVFMKGAQIGATEAGNNWLGYIIHHAPGPILSVQPTVEAAKRNSKQRIDPLIEDSKVLKGLVKDRRSRDSGNTILTKEFPGGILVMTGANSAIGLRSMAARYLFLDEIDGYPGDVEGEGDPVNLALARTRTFARRKIFIVSTPTIGGQSRIERAYEDSDKRQFWVPCPFCDEPQVLKFAKIRWPKGQPGKAVYVCEHCNAEIENHRKTWMLEHGEWRASAVGDGRTVGFHLSSLYSPVGWYSWADAARQFDKGHNTPELLKSFVNTVLGETWTERGEAPDWEILILRRERYDTGTVPLGGLFVTAGVDVQRDRLEVERVAWGRNLESWSVGYDVIEGKTSDQQVWRKLEDLLAAPLIHANGAPMPVSRTFVDSGDGTTTNDVYLWARTQPPSRVTAIKGYDGGYLPVGDPSSVDISLGGKKHEGGLKIKTVKVSFFKDSFYSQLKLRPPTKEERSQGLAYPAGYCHFPDVNSHGDEYFKQLTAEQLVSRKNNKTGRTRTEWQKVRDRNEALDCRIYARAAAWDFGLDIAQEVHWKALEAELNAAVAKPTEMNGAGAVAVMAKKQRKESGWIPQRHWFD